MIHTQMPHKRRHAWQSVSQHQWPWNLWQPTSLPCSIIKTMRKLYWAREIQVLQTPTKCAMVTLSRTGACLCSGGLFETADFLLKGGTMLRRRPNLRPERRSIGRERALNFESLEGRIVLAAGIAHDRASRVLSIGGSARATTPCRVRRATTGSTAAPAATKSSVARAWIWKSAPGIASPTATSTATGTTRLRLHGHPLRGAEQPAGLCR